MPSSLPFSNQVDTFENLKLFLATFFVLLTLEAEITFNDLALVLISIKLSAASKERLVTAAKQKLPKLFTGVGGGNLV